MSSRREFGGLISVVHCAVLAICIGLFAAGMFMSLFGPASGRWLGIPAFLVSVLTFVRVGNAKKQMRLRALVEDFPPLVHLRSIHRCLMGLIGIVALISIIALFASARLGGGTDGTRPVFEQQEKYILNNHGTHTVVSRVCYLVVGSSFMIGWHLSGILIALGCLDVLLFGRLPQEEADGGEQPSGLTSEDDGA